MFKIIGVMVILGLIILNIIYRLEIKNIYKQIDFINDNETNKIVTQNIHFKEITSLVDQLNKLILVHRELGREYKVKNDENPVTHIFLLTRYSQY